MSYVKDIYIKLEEYLNKKYSKISSIEDIEINEYLKKMEREKLKTLSLKELEKFLKEVS